MTHINVISGTPKGGPAPRDLTLGPAFQNVSTSFAAQLNYVVANTLTLGTRYQNTSTFYDVDLDPIEVTELTLTHHTNAITTYAVVLAALPFEAENDETTTLLAAFTADYPTSRKLQIDRFIGDLKDAGIWAKLDWLHNGRLTLNEHDSLINWVNPAQTLVKVGSPTYAPDVGWTGVSPSTSINNKLKSGWNVSNGPHATATSMCAFIRIESCPNENGLQPMGLFQYSTPGPAAPVGTFMLVNVPSGNWSGGVNTFAFDGVSGVGLGAFPSTLAVNRNGATVEIFEEGASDGTDGTAGNSVYTHAEGMCILGSATGFLAGRAFGGLVSMAGWGASMSGAELTALDVAFATSLLPPDVGGTGPTGALIVNDDLDYIGDESGDYLITDGA